MENCFEIEVTSRNPADIAEAVVLAVSEGESVWFRYPQDKKKRGIPFVAQPNVATWPRISKWILKRIKEKHLSMYNTEGSWEISRSRQVIFVEKRKA